MAKTSGGGSVKKIEVPSAWFIETRKKLEQEASKPKRGKGPLPEKEELIREFYGKLGTRLLARQLGLTEGCVRYWAAKWGLTYTEKAK